METILLWDDGENETIWLKVIATKRGIDFCAMGESGHATGTMITWEEINDIKKSIA